MHWVRESIAQRLGEPELRAALGAKHDGAQSAHAYWSLLRNEIEALESRLDRIWRLRVTGAATRPGLHVNAANFALSAHIYGGVGEAQASIEFALGTALAMDDLALFALCNDLFLAPNLAQLDVLAKQEVSAYAAQRVVGAQKEFAGRYKNYRQLAQAPSLQRDYLTYAMASAPWRVMQASMLSDLMLAFTLLHERAHFALGHLDDLSAEQNGALSLAEAGVADAMAAPRRRSRERYGRYRAERRLMEIQADLHAFLLLCAYALSNEGPCAAYIAGLSICEAPPTALHEIGLDEAMRLCLTATCLACLLFHLGVNPDPGLRNPLYPSPEARLMNLMVNTPLLSPITHQDEAGFIIRHEGADEGALDRLVREVFAMSLSDLRIVSTYFDGALSPLQRSGEAQISPALWVEDLGVFWRVEDEAQNRAPVTAPAQELWALAPLERRLVRRLRKRQRSRFGKDTSVDVADLMAGWDQNGSG